MTAALAVAAGSLGQSLALLVQMLVVIGVVGGTTWLALRALGRWQTRSTSGGLEVLARCGLDPRTTLWVVRVGSRVLLLGSGSDGVRTLAELDESDVRAFETTADEGASFLSLLAAKRRDGGGDGPASSAD